jgi:hypothetical protein
MSDDLQGQSPKVFGRLSLVTIPSAVVELDWNSILTQAMRDIIVLSQCYRNSRHNPHLLSPMNTCNINNQLFEFTTPISKA